MRSIKGKENFLTKKVTLTVICVGWLLWIVLTCSVYGFSLGPGPMLNRNQCTVDNESTSVGLYFSLGRSFHGLVVFLLNIIIFLLIIHVLHSDYRALLLPEPQNKIMKKKRFRRGKNQEQQCENHRHEPNQNQHQNKQNKQQQHQQQRQQNQRKQHKQQGQQVEILQLNDFGIRRLQGQQHEQRENQVGEIQNLNELQQPEQQQDQQEQERQQQQQHGVLQIVEIQHETHQNQQLGEDAAVGVNARKLNPHLVSQKRKRVVKMLQTTSLVLLSLSIGLIPLQISVFFNIFVPHSNQWKATFQAFAGMAYLIKSFINFFYI